MNRRKFFKGLFGLCGVAVLPKMAERTTVVRTPWLKMDEVYPQSYGHMSVDISEVMTSTTDINAIFNHTETKVYRDDNGIPLARDLRVFSGEGNREFRRPTKYEIKQFKALEKQHKRLIKEGAIKDRGDSIVLTEYKHNI